MPLQKGLPGDTGSDMMRKGESRYLHLAGKLMLAVGRTPQQIPMGLLHRLLECPMMWLLIPPE